MSITSYNNKNIRNAVSAALFFLAASSLSAHAAGDWMASCHPDESSGSSCIEPYSEGLAAVLVGSEKDEHGRWGFIDLSGHMAIAPAYTETHIFSNGLAAVENEKGWGYIDRKGEWVIPAQFSDAGEFNTKGMALIGQDGIAKLINRAGQVVKTFPAGVAPHFYYTFKPNGVYAEMAVDQPDLMWNTVKGQKIALPADVSTVGFAQDGIIPAWHLDAQYKGRWGYLDSSGTHWSIAPDVFQSEEMPLHHHGVFAVKMKDRWRFMDAKGAPLSAADYDSVSIVRPGTWWAENGETSQLLDEKLKPIYSFSSQVYLSNEHVFGDWIALATAQAVLLIGSEGRLKIIPAKQPAIEERDGYLWISESLTTPLTSSLSTSPTTSLASSDDEASSDKVLTQILNREGQPLLSDAVQRQLGQYKVYPIYRDNKKIDEQRMLLPLADLNPKDDQQAHGILTPSGKIVTNPNWDDLKSDSSTTAPLVVKTKDERFGAIDAEGQWVVQPSYANIRTYRQGFSWAKLPESERGQALLIDATGTQMPALPERVLAGANDDVVDGILAFEYQTGDGRKWGLWNVRTGHEIEGSHPDEIETFNGGYANARKGNLWGVMNAKSEWAIQALSPSSSDLTYLGDAIFSVSHQTGRMAHGYKESVERLVSAITGRDLTADLVGKLDRISANRYLAHPATGGVALFDAEGHTLLSSARHIDDVKTQGDFMILHSEEHHGLIDAAGEWQLPPTFVSFEYLSEAENLVRVFDGQSQFLTNIQGVKQLDGLDGLPLSGMGLIVVDDEEKNQTRLLNLQAQELAHFDGRFAVNADTASEGLVVFGQDEKYGFVDAQAVRVIGARFDQLQAMKNGLAIATQNGKSGKLKGFIDRTGRFVIQPVFEFAFNFAEGRSLVVRKGVTQFIDKKGDVQASFAQRCGQIVINDGQGNQTWPQQAMSCAAAKRKK